MLSHSYAASQDTTSQEYEQSHIDDDGLDNEDDVSVPKERAETTPRQKTS